MEKCTLCGGRIIDGRCQDCGMPYPKEKRYTLRGEMAHTHEVNGEKILHRVRLTPPFKQDATQRPTAQSSARRGQSPKADLRQRGRSGQAVGKLVWGIVLLVLVLNIVQWVLGAATLS